jgi:DNA-binding NarL/FixJ family response regulator
VVVPLEPIVNVRGPANIVPRWIAVASEDIDESSANTIGSHLSISEATVKAHLKSVMLKLGASDRTHAVNIAMNRGFLM